MEAMGSLVVAIVAHGEDGGKANWPFVTLTSFQQRAATVKDLSGALYIGFNPLVRFYFCFTFPLRHKESSLAFV